jgi:alanyl-tRNA synthetase
MTDRLYYTDAYMREFDAVIERVDVHDGVTSIRLDRSAFYPTSGGQPFDTGTLDEARVIDVIDESDGAMSHVIAPGSPSFAAGQRVRGRIDWERRFDHMQQHTGQHVLSAAIEHLFSVPTISFHLGSDSSTIDVARELSAAEIRAAEEAANRIVWEDRPAGVRFVDEAEASQLPFRKPPARRGRLRIVEIAGHDLSACGGTHVATTGAIGAIVVRALERIRSTQRLEFVCGGRALARYRRLQDAIGEATRLLSVQPEDLALAVGRLQHEVKDAKRAQASLSSELAGHRAADLVRTSKTMPFGQLVLASLDADALGLKATALDIASRSGFVAGLVSQSRPVLAVLSCAADVELDASAIMKELLSRLGGRGGGKRDLAQGGAIDTPPDHVLELFNTILNNKSASPGTSPKI